MLPRQATQTAVLSADNKSDGQSASSHPETALLSADNKPADGTVRGTAKPPAQRQPKQEGSEPATDSAEAVSDEPDSHGQPRQLPYDNAFYVVNHLHLKMEPAAFAESARLWLGILREQHPDEYSALLRELSEQQPA